MDNPPRLQPGSQIRCPHCRRLHPLIKPYVEGTEYTRAMLFVECRGRRYYAGQESGTSQHTVRRSNQSTVITDPCDPLLLEQLVMRPGTA